jgi:aspartate/methionine/tyrosine aminotransferase
VILASPANPTGTIIPREELAAIAEVCRTRGITIISDEIYHGIAYDMGTPSILEVEPDALVVNSFSKYWSMAGWRLGWLVVPIAGIDAARARMGNLFLTPPSLAQHAGLVAMDCTADLQANIATYARNRELLLAALPAWVWVGSHRQMARSTSMQTFRNSPTTAWNSASNCCRIPALPPLRDRFRSG